jgi:D-2-hydroxyacid dehydrogenase (NADP+)
MLEVVTMFMHPLEQNFLEQIAAVAPGIKVTDASILASAEDKGDFCNKEKLDALLTRAEIICGYWPTKDLLARAPSLKWFHTLLTGVDRPGFPEIIRSQVILSNSAGIHSVQVSEWALMLMLNLAKQVSHFFKMQQGKKWEAVIPPVLEGKTLGILGLGNIGKRVAKLGKAFGMRVIATEQIVKEATTAENVDSLLPANGLNQLLAESDFVLISLPATPETIKLIGEKELRGMKRSAFLINVARGTIIDEAALVHALKEKWISGAGLDTVAREPLSPESELWDLPNVIITPHVAGRRDDYNKVAVPLFCENLKRYLNHETLINLLNKERGY